MRYVAFHDLIAGVASLLLLVGVLALAGLGRDVPPLLTNGLTLALGWVFRGGVQAANEYSHQRRNRNDNAPTG